MLTLKKAFFEGVANPKLLQDWEIQNKNFKLGDVLAHHESRFQGFLLLGVVIILLDLRNKAPQWLIGPISLTSLVVGFIGLLCLSMALFSYAPRAFLADCKELMLLCPGVVQFDHSYLLEWVNKNLTHRALTVLQSEIATGAMSQETEVERANFKKAFTIYQKFQLTLEDWKPYFENATTILDQR